MDTQLALQAIQEYFETVTNRTQNLINDNLENIEELLSISIGYDIGVMYNRETGDFEYDIQIMTAAAEDGKPKSLLSFGGGGAHLVLQGALNKLKEKIPMYLRTGEFDYALIYQTVYDSLIQADNLFGTPIWHMSNVLEELSLAED